MAGDAACASSLGPMHWAIPGGVEPASEREGQPDDPMANGHKPDLLEANLHTWQLLLGAALSLLLPMCR